MSNSRPQDFAADVMAILHQRKVKFRGCRPESLEIFLGGSMKIWFCGHRDGKAWRGGVTLMHRDAIDKAVHLGDSSVVADLAENIIDHQQARFH